VERFARSAFEHTLFLAGGCGHGISDSSRRDTRGNACDNRFHIHLKYPPFAEKFFRNNAIKTALSYNYFYPLLKINTRIFQAEIPIIVWF